VFYFDLASPLAYLAAEQIMRALPGAAEWQPVLASELPGGESFEAYRCRTEEEVFRGEVERRARTLGLQPMIWPSEFPFDSTLAMRVATYAKSIGRTVPFAQAAFRQAFAAGRTLAEQDNVLIAAAACELHPTAVLKGAALASVRTRLSEATTAAARAGVDGVPAVRLASTRAGAEGQVFVGERCVVEAAARLRGDTPGDGPGPGVAATIGGAR
jgi:2-hydroxychromene-2-carboxylate isomerase